MTKINVSKIKKEPALLDALFNEVTLEVQANGWTVKLHARWARLKAIQSLLHSLSLI